MQVIRAVQARTGGSFFHSVIPDAYSSVAIASAISDYYYSSRPFSVNGASRHSNGANTEAFLQGEDGASATRQFVEETDLRLHSDMPILIMGSSIAVALEAFLQANEHCFGGALPIDVDAALTKIVKEVSASQPARYDSVRGQLLDLVQDDARRQRLVRRALERYPNRPGPFGPSRLGVGADDVLWTSLTSFGVEDVYAATRFVHGLLGPYAPPLRIGRYSHYSKILSRAIAEGRRRINPYLW